jgi:hypothetical protein
VFFGKDAIVLNVSAPRIQQISVSDRDNRDRCNCALSRLLIIFGFLTTLLSLSIFGSVGSVLAQQIDYPQGDPTHVIRLEGHVGERWDQGDYRIYRLRDGARLVQGVIDLQADEIVLWVDRTVVPSSGRLASSLEDLSNTESSSSLDPSSLTSVGDDRASNRFETSDRKKLPSKFIVQCNGRFRGSWGDGQRLEAAQWAGRLYSFANAELPSIDWVTDSSQSPPPLPEIDAASNRFDSKVVAAQYQTPVTPPPTLSAPNLSSPQTAPGLLAPSGTGGTPLAAPSTLPTAVGSPQVNIDLGTQTGGTNLPGGLPAGGVTIEAGRAMPTQQDNPATAPVIQGNVPFGTPANSPPAIAAPPLGTVPGPISAPPSPLAPAVMPSAVSNAPGTTGPFTAKSITVRGRSSAPPQVRLTQRVDRGDSVAEITRGVYIHIADSRVVSSTGTVTELGSIDIETDRAIMWMPNLAGLDLSSGSANVNGQQTELYLEGNIVFRQGQRVIYAERMYYNVAQEYGMILAAEVLTPVPEYQGLLRLKADVLQQRNRQNFLAYDAALTSSRLGVPRYWLQAQRVEFEDRRPDDPGLLAGLPGFQDNKTEMMASSRNNFVYLDSIPVLYWPVMSTNLARPNFYLTSAKVKNDSIFGAQAMLDWDMYQILGINGADGTDWSLSTDYFSERGFALGTNFSYDLPRCLVPGRAYGQLDFWGIDDGGLDTLGSDRVLMTPEETKRGRLLLQHRHLLSADTEFWAEVGYITDRNFLEQYLERSWDQDKDYSTALRLRRYNENQMFDIWGQARVNDFFTETEWLPRADWYWLGQPIFDRLTWYAHTFAGYGHQQVSTTPLDPQDAAKFKLRPWETDSEGLVAVTRQELGIPLAAGPLKLNPYISGEAGFWKEDVTQDDVSRLTGQAGVRTSLPFWQLYPNFQNRLFDVKGLAHKVNLKSDFLYADSNQNLDRFPLYNQLDDNSQEHFRRRLVFNTFGGSLPAQFDERSYTLRNGLQRWVSASSSEIVDDQLQWRFGVDQRWQTKRGLPGRERIVDLVQFDVDAIFFPNPDRDNFGESVGAINYDFRYHVGDRLTLLSDGYFDTFTDGLKSYSLGAQISRVGRGELYLGAMKLSGPIDSTILTATLNYRMNEKWIVSGGTTFDLGEVGNVGQTIGLTRVGESFLVRIGMNVDAGRDNVGFTFNIEPRFLPARKLGALAGELIPPANAFGLE